MRAPKFSVCVPTFNQGDFLAEALESVLRQTEQDFEIVVCDDASTDATPEVVGAFREPRLRYFRAPENAGIAENRNRCLARARGRYIAWLDSDDVYLPHMLEVQGAVLDRTPGAGLVHGAFEVVDPEGRRLPDWPLPFPSDRVEPGADALRELVLWNYVTAPTVLVRREAHERAGPYDPRIGRSSTDWDMWLRIALGADVAYTAAPVARYRQHPDSISTTTTRTGERLRCDLAVVEGLFRRHRGRIPDAAALERRARAALATRALMLGGDAFLLGRRGDALAAARLARRVGRAAPDAPAYARLALAIRRGDEYGVHSHSKSLLARQHARLAGSRYAERIRKVAVRSPEWDAVLRGIADTIRRLLPPAARIAVIDKWDPTLLHLSGRRGWHFPDRRALAEGYPRGGEEVVEQLEAVRRDGADYLVIPVSAFWWMDHYAELRAHLEGRCETAWSDERCRIYRLVPRTADHPSPGVPCAAPS